MNKLHHRHGELGSDPGAAKPGLGKAEVKFLVARQGEQDMARQDSRSDDDHIRGERPKWKSKKKCTF